MTRNYEEKFRNYLEKIMYCLTSLPMIQFIQNHLKSIFRVLIFTIVSELTKLAAKFLLIFEIILLPGISYISLYSTSDQPILRNVNKLTNFSLLGFIGQDVKRSYNFRSENQKNSFKN